MYRFSDSKNVHFHLKVVINKQKTKVLYAEANSEFADVLLSFLTLPLGTIVRVLQKHDPKLLVGSLTTLYKGLASLDSVHFQAERCKQMLLNPRTSYEAARHQLKLNVDDTDQPTKYFRCANKDCGFNKYPHGRIHNCIPIKCDCGKSTFKEILFKDSRAQGVDDVANGVYTMRTAHFIISDDLQILPSETGNVIRFLSNIGITDMDETELMDVTFGFNGIMSLLKGSLLSDTPLTDIVLNKRQVESFAAKYEMGTMKSATSNSKLIVKAVLQKSTNKLLFVEGDEKFVEFLFSLLTIPLGGIERLLDGSTKFKSIDNLYRTLGDINGDKYLKTQATKTMLLYPKLAFGYRSNSQFLSLTDEIPPSLCIHQDSLSNEGYLSFSSYFELKYRTTVSLQSPKGQGNYVKGPTMYMVTDDLVVTPLCTTSTLSVLKRLGVLLSDVREMELNIGLEEALRILKASLTSNRALSDGLINPLLDKQPKQEQRV